MPRWEELLDRDVHPQWNALFAKMRESGGFKKQAKRRDYARIPTITSREEAQYVSLKEAAALRKVSYAEIYKNVVHRASLKHIMRWAPSDTAPSGRAVRWYVKRSEVMALNLVPLAPAPVPGVPAVPVDMERFTQIVAHPPTDDELKPYILYKGNITFQRARAGWNLVNGLFLAQPPNLTSALKTARAETGFRHMAGFHVNISNLTGMFSRIVSSPELTERVPDLARWIHDIAGPRFLNHYEAIPEIGNDYYSKRAWRRPIRVPRVRPPPDTPPELLFKTSADPHAELLRTADNAIPAGITGGDRQDLCSDLVLGLLTGEFTANDMQAAAREVIKKHRRMYSRFEARSLDEELRGYDDPTYLKDRIKVESAW